MIYSPTPYDIQFRFLNFPVRIHPMFWLVFFILGVGFHRTIENMSIWFLETAIWIAAAFISILVHELGHALVFRYLFNVPSNIVIHGFGGVTIPLYPPSRRYDWRGMFSQVFLSAAGPLAGFLLAGMIIGFIFNFGLPVLFSLGGDLNLRVIMLSFLVQVAAISLIWGIFNLLPIYPMDGGHISREIFSFFSPRNGIVNSLVLSMTIAVLLGVLAFARFHEPFITFLFGYFAYQNFQELSFRSFRP